MSNPRLTINVLKVLSIVASCSSDKGIAGSDLGKETGLASGTLYPLLVRLEAAKWLKSEWETGDPSELGRPRKRYYSVTGVGRSQLASKEAADMRGLTFA